MSDIKTELEKVLKDLRHKHINEERYAHLIEIGVSEEDARKWVSGIGHIVGRYTYSLEKIADLLKQNNVEDAAEELDVWLDFTRESIVLSLKQTIQSFEGSYEKYLPPDDEDGE